MNNYLMFGYDDKILALKITKEWNTCEAFIYNMDNHNVTYFKDNGYPSYERSFFASFLCPSDIVKVCPKDEYNGSYIPSAPEVWTFRKQDKVTNYIDLENAIISQSNKCEDIADKLYKEYREK